MQDVERVSCRSRSLYGERKIVVVAPTAGRYSVLRSRAAVQTRLQYRSGADSTTRSAARTRLLEGLQYALRKKLPQFFFQPPSPLPAAGLVMEGRESEGMREADTALESRDLSLAAKLLLVHAHKKCKTIGEQTIIISTVLLLPASGLTSQRKKAQNELAWPKYIRHSFKSHMYSVKFLKITIAAIAADRPRGSTATGV